MATYTELKADLLRYADRDPTQDTEFAGAIPRIFDNAQRRIVRECNLSAFHVQDDAVMATSTRTIARPANLLAFVYCEVLVTASELVQLKWRSSSWIRRFWPSPSTVDVPRYIGLNDEDTLIVAPTPAADYPYHLGSRRLRELLSEATQETYLSREFPELLLSALMIEAQLFAKADQAENQGELNKWKAEFVQHKRAAIASEMASGTAATDVGTIVEQA